MRKSILFLIVIILLSACGSTKKTRRSKRAMKQLNKLEMKYSDVWDTVTTKLVTVDTVIKQVTIQGETKLKYDTVYLDSIISIVDTVNTIEYKTLFKYILRSIVIDTLHIDSGGVKLDVYYNSDFGSLNYLLLKDSIKISKTEKVNMINPTVYKKDKKHWAYWFFLGFITALGITVIALLIKLK